MSFAFLPRSVTKGGKAPQNTAAGPARLPATNTTIETSHPSEDKGKTSHADSTSRAEDAAILIALALSEHALWTNPSLRDPNRDGFISLSHLTHSTPYLRASTLPNEVLIMKALKTLFADTFETRMIMVNTSRSSRHASDSDYGGYEIRRKDWKAVVERFSEFDRAYWQARIIYIENIPHSSRTVAGIVRLVTRLLPDDASFDRLQNVVLPPHHQDPPHALPKCKGFALITLSRLADAEVLLRDWPWHRDTDAADSNSDVTQSGFRALSKPRWDQLQDEYNAYRARLHEVMAAPPTQKYTARTTPSTPSHPQQKRPPPAPVPQAPEAPHALTAHSPFPPNCVIYVRNVHPSTNKTTLRALFASAFPPDGELTAAGIDYVDFTKGLDTCHLRLATPAHAAHLLAHFIAHPQVHGQPLDTGGAAEGGKPLVLEVLQGRKEEAYWEYIPEKVRAQAVQKALAGAGAGVADESQDGARQRKRRRQK